MGVLGVQEGGVMGWKEPNRCEEVLPLLGIQTEEKHITFGALCRLQCPPPHWHNRGLSSSLVAHRGQ